MQDRARRDLSDTSVQAFALGVPLAWSSIRNPGPIAPHAGADVVVAGEGGGSGSSDPELGPGLAYYGPTRVPHSHRHAKVLPDDAAFASHPASKLRRGHALVSAFGRGGI